MKPKAHARAAKAHRQSVAQGSVDYFLRLFVAGASTRSRDAVLHVRRLCAAQLAGGWRLEVVDIYQQPRLARAHQIVATPTLIQESPRPVRRFVGSLAKATALFGGPALMARSLL